MAAHLITICCALGLALAGCNDVTQPPDAKVADVEITQRDLKLAIGDSVDVDAAARMSDGTVVSGQNFIWSTTTPNLLAVTIAGRVTAVGEPSLSTSDSVNIAWLKAATSSGRVVDSAAIKVCRSYRAVVGERLKSAPSAITAFDRMFLFGSASVTFDDYSVINIGGILVSVGNTSLSTYNFPNFRRGSPLDFDHASMCRLDTPHGAYTRSVLVAKSERNLPLRIERESFSPTIVGNGSTLLLRFTISNTGASLITAIRFALGLDWDVAINSQPVAVGSNRSRFNTVLDAAEVYLPGLETAGIASIGSKFTIYAAWPVTGLTFEAQGDVAELIKQGIVVNTIRGDVDTDIANLVGFGPFDLNAGESRELEMVIAAGYSREEFSGNVAAARAVADAFPRRLRVEPDN